MADQVTEIMKSEGRTKSELLREALRRYIEDREWRKLLRYGERRAREQGIDPEDLDAVVDGYRGEVSQPRE